MTSNNVIYSLEKVVIKHSDILFISTAVCRTNAVELI